MKSAKSLVTGAVNGEDRSFYNPEKCRFAGGELKLGEKNPNPPKFNKGVFKNLKMKERKGQAWRRQNKKRGKSVREVGREG